MRKAAPALPGIRTGDDVWCQLWTEPDAGSDLASIATTAVRTSTGSGGDGVASPDSAARRAARQAGGQPAPPTAEADTNQPKQDPQKPEKKKGIFQRILGVFK